MKTGKIGAVLALLVFHASAGPVLAQVALGSRASAAGTQSVSNMTGREACAIERELFPLHYAARGGVHGVHFVKDGLVFDEHKDKQESLAYTDITKVDFSPGVFSHADVIVHAQAKRHSYFFEFLLVQASNERVTQLQRALMTMAQQANSGRPYLCSDNAQDYAEALADFQVKTASWRALETKPPVSDDVYKYRLLAEDALKNRDLNAAAGYYESGVFSDPTWAQGWYNAALVYAELKAYGDAAYAMKHYVVLLPNAPDVQPAKDNIILWEAKAPNLSSGAASPTPALAKQKKK